MSKHPHKLEFKDPGYEKGYKCDECSKEYKKGEKSHHCAACKYDLCATCFRKAQYAAMPRMMVAHMFHPANGRSIFGASEAQTPSTPSLKVTEALMNAMVEREKELRAVELEEDSIAKQVTEEFGFTDLEEGLKVLAQARTKAH